MSIGQRIHVDDEGNVDSVTAASSTPTRMFETRWAEGVVSFGINDGPDVDRYEFDRSTRITRRSHRFFLEKSGGYSLPRDDRSRSRSGSRRLLNCATDRRRIGACRLNGGFPPLRIEESCRRL